MKRRGIRIVLLLLLPAVGVVAMWVHHFRPLIPTTSWALSAADATGKILQAQPFRMLGKPNLIFVKIPNTGRPNDGWFVISVDDRRVASPNGPRYFPYLSYNNDRAIGVLLGDGKLEENWEVEWTGDQVVFIGNNLTVTASPTTY